MKFKDLEIGQKFKMKGWDTVDVKIEPEELKDPEGVKPSKVARHRGVSDGIGGAWIKDDDEVTPVD